MMDERFNRIVGQTLESEGGYVDDPNDPGGETKFGISKRRYRSVDIRSLTRDDAAVIYYVDWWQKYDYGAIEDEAIAAKVFDLSVNMGPDRAHRLLQAAVCGAGHRIAIDGIIGPETLGAINGHPVPEFILANLMVAAVRFYVSRNSARYEKGWVKRAVSRHGAGERRPEWTKY